MQKIGIFISRECGYVMRGMAIVMIALHNFCHIAPRVVAENEFLFFPDHIAQLEAPKETITAYIFDYLSFFGWYGVPVFMFLTGYGLVMKYERDKTPLSTTRFLGDNYLKLLFLMFPAVIALIILIISTALPYGHLGLKAIIDTVLQLTMLPDLVMPWWPPNPGVFWYFGLTMEFYIIYAFFIYDRRPWLMWLLVGLSLGMQFFTDSTSINMEWIRHNATGWMTVFVFGIVYGRTSSIGRWIVIAIVSLSTLLLWPSMLNNLSWQFSILAWVVISIASAKISMLVPGWRGLWTWIGRLSPMIFVAHPVARSIIYKTLSHESPTIYHIAIYIFITLILALIFRRVTYFCYRRFLAPRYMTGLVSGTDH